MSETAEKLTKLVNEFAENEAKFDKGNKTAGVRARKALQEIRILCGERRKEFLAKKE